MILFFQASSGSPRFRSHVERRVTIEPKANKDKIVEKVYFTGDQFVRSNGCLFFYSFFARNWLKNGESLEKID